MMGDEFVLGVSDRIDFILRSAPVGQMRHSHRAVGGHSQAFKNPKQRFREDTLQAMMLPHVPAVPFSGPVVLGVRIFLPIPKTRPKGQPRQWHDWARAGLVVPTCKPDLSNAIKHLEDCMSAMGFWHDDSQVARYAADNGKFYSDDPRWEVSVETWRPNGS